MLDFLRAPAGRYDAMDIARIVALCAIVNQRDRFDEFNNNRALLEKVEQRLGTQTRNTAQPW